MQIVSPAFIMVGAFSAVVGYALPDIQRAIDPPPGQVHNFTVLPEPCGWQAETFNGCVVQAWTIHADGVFIYVVCDPVVLLDTSCTLVPGCAGNGRSCGLLRVTYGDRAFRLPATWYWRSDQSTHLSQDFVLAE